MEARGRELVFPESHVSERGRTELRNVWTPNGADSYEIVVTELKGGEWREMWRMTMRRERR